MAESRVLYATAHMLFLRAGQNVTDATLRAKIALYNALTLFLAAPDGLETVALQEIWNDILPQNSITTWPADLKNEAHFYRARIRREVEIDSEVEDEYELIDEVDPRAAFAIGYDLRPGNPDRVAQGILELLSKPKVDWSSAFDVLRDRFNWSEIVRPLRRYLLEGDYAADYKAHGRNQRIRPVSRRNRWRNHSARARYIIRTQGYGALLERVFRNIRAYLTKFLDVFV